MSAYHRLRSLLVGNMFPGLSFKVMVSVMAHVHESHACLITPQELVGGRGSAVRI